MTINKNNSDAEYNILNQAKASIGSDLVYLGTSKICRFCKCSDPKKFKSKAHTFPEALGNKWIFSRDECDLCNNKFGIEEDQLVKVIRPILTVGGVQGKTGVPQTGRTNSEAYIRAGTEGGKRRLSVKLKTEPKDVYYQDPISGNLNVRIPVRTEKFKPRSAYRSLCKMAVSILPEEELTNFNNLINWLNINNRQDDKFPSEVGISFASIGNSPPLVCGALLKRNDFNSTLPYIIFILCIGSVCLQIRLMSDDYDINTPDEVYINYLCTNVLAKPEGGYFKLTYENYVKFNWKDSDLTDNPIEYFSFQFNPVTRQGAFTPIIRT